MQDLNKYYNSLFEKAHQFSFIHFWIELIFIGLVIVSNFFNGQPLYLLTFLGTITQITGFIIYKQQQKTEGLAHKLQEYAMLYEYYGTNTFNFDISQIKGEVPLSIHNKVTKITTEPESAKYTVKDGDKNELILKLQENCFWNSHQYRYCYWTSIVKTFIWVALIVTTFWISLGTPLIDQEFLFPRILLIFLSFNLLWMEIDKILLWYDAANSMLALDNSIERQKTFEQDFLVHAFARYNLTKATAPLIKDGIYNLLRSKLNKAWESRFNLQNENTDLKNEA